MRALGSDDCEAPGRPAREWIPGRTAAAVINIIGVLAVPAGLTLHFFLWARGQSAGGWSFDIVQLLIGIAVTVVLTAILLVVHEAVHAVGMRIFGARPTFGFTRIGGKIPVAYCIAPGQRFTKSQYVIIALAPLVLLGGGCALIVAVVPFGGWLVLPAAVHLAGCAGDAALVFTALRQPPGTLIEELPAGLKFVSCASASG